MMRNDEEVFLYKELFSEVDSEFIEKIVMCSREMRYHYRQTHQSIKDGDGYYSKLATYISVPKWYKIINLYETVDENEVAFAVCKEILKQFQDLEERDMWLIRLRAIFELTPEDLEKLMPQ